ncbi:hypothetical protein E5D57_008057 [Metarhizium anisopliae]|nr:hypothetical protein E5D57_008057 [Metarhizium anisopliae]
MGKEVELKCGGMVISDTRLGFRALKGHAIIGIFADKNGDEIQKWDKIELRTIDDLKEEVTEMQKCGIWTNFTFV